MRADQRLGFFRGGEPGQTFILAPLFLFLFMIGATLGVDLGRVYVARRSAQAAVDFAALAAAQELPRSDLDANIPQMVSDAVLQANTYLRLNSHDPAASDVYATITPYYDGNVRKIRVEVQRDHEWIFAGFFGIPDPTVGASAVAEANSTPRRRGRRGTQWRRSGARERFLPDGHGERDQEVPRYVSEPAEDRTNRRGA